MKAYLEKIASGEHLTRQEAAHLLEAILDGRLSDAQMGAVLMGLRTRGETVEEIAGFVDVLQKHMVTVTLRDADALDVCGTGGDGRGTFNVSTTVALVLAGGGVTVAKHGNRSISSRCGSADVLEALGISVDLGPEQVKKCIDELGIGFLFAPRYHPAFKILAPIRRQLAVRTVFNLLGPLLNPARVQRQMIGAFSREAAERLAGVLAVRGVRKACTLHSDDGYDEVSPFAETTLFFVQGQNGVPMETTYRPSTGGQGFTPEQLKGGSASDNARLILKVLQGHAGAPREMVLHNAALGFLVADRVSSMEEGLRLAAEVIDGGLALKKLRAWREASRDLAGRTESQMAGMESAGG